jgi:hypothetical protein
MRGKQDLFRRFPLDGSVTIAGEELTTPYHVNNGTMLCLGGTVDRSVAADLLAREELTPLSDTQGRALAAIWVCDFADANLGAHHELQISLFATPRSSPPLPADPFAFFRALATRSDLLMVCHGLWNNTERVVRYNAEHLLLNARLTQSKVRFERSRWAFEFRDVQGALIAEGAVRASHAQPPGPSWQIARQMGLRAMLRLIRSPIANIAVVNTRRLEDDCNYMCQTYTACARPFIRPAGPEDRISIEHPIYRRLDFSIGFVQQLNDVGFIFLRPSRLAPQEQRKS